MAYKRQPACKVVAVIAGIFINEKRLDFHLTLFKERTAKKRLTDPMRQQATPATSLENERLGRTETYVVNY
jgi:hypothetical protein